MFRLTPELWKDDFIQLCREKNLPTDDFHAFKDGSNLIAALGKQWIVKVFPPFLRHQWESENRVMRHLDGRLSLPIPHFVEAGPIGEGWTFIIMSRLPGVTLEGLWPQLNLTSKISIMHDIGRIMAKVHSLSIQGVEDLPPPWPEFFPKQIQGCRARHQRLGMPAWFVDRVDAFVQSGLSLIPSRFKAVVLTGEYTPFNLLVDDSPKADRIAGMIDFGDAMIGYSEYDLLGPLLFLGEGKPELIESLLLGYGFRLEDFTVTLRRRLFILQILHRYSNFKEQVRIPNWQDRVQSLEELEQLIWPLS